MISKLKFSSLVSFLLALSVGVVSAQGGRCAMIAEEAFADLGVVCARIESGQSCTLSSGVVELEDLVRTDESGLAMLVTEDNLTAGDEQDLAMILFGESELENRVDDFDDEVETFDSPLLAALTSDEQVFVSELDGRTYIANSQPDSDNTIHPFQISMLHNETDCADEFRSQLMILGRPGTESGDTLRGDVSVIELNGVEIAFAGQIIARFIPPDEETPVDEDRQRLQLVATTDFLVINEDFPDAFTLVPRGHEVVIEFEEEAPAAFDARSADPILSSGAQSLRIAHRPDDMPLFQRNNNRPVITISKPQPLSAVDVAAINNLNDLLDRLPPRLRRIVERALQRICPSGIGEPPCEFSLGD